MPLVLAAPLFSTTDRLKATRLFHYASTTVDLDDGMVVEMDTATTTYGLGKACIKGTTTASGSFIGPVDSDVDASALGDTFSPIYRTIPVVVAGVKEDVLADGSSTEKKPQMASAGTAGQITDVTAGNEHYAFLVALETDAGAGTGVDCLVRSMWWM